MLPNTVNTPNNEPVGGGCGNGNGTCCSSSTTTSPPTTAVVVDIEDLLNKRNLERNKKDSKDASSTPTSENDS